MKINKYKEGVFWPICAKETLQISTSTGFKWNHQSFTAQLVRYLLTLALMQLPYMHRPSHPLAIHDITAKIKTHK